jgi:hypothetical protein
MTLTYSLFVYDMGILVHALWLPITTSSNFLVIATPLLALLLDMALKWNKDLFSSQRIRHFDK